MKYIEIIFICIASIIMHSCTKKYKPVINRDITRIIIEDNNSKEYDYSNFIDSLKVIRLETNKNSIIGGIRKTVFRNGRFYILDKNHNLLIFSQEGRFIQKLNKRGKGPEEYIEMRDFFVDDNGNIKILSWQKIITYNPELRFIGSIYLKCKSKSGRELNPIFFMPNGENIFLFMGSFALKNISSKENALFCINKNQKVINEFFPIQYDYTNLHRMFYKSNASIYYANGLGNDTIYQIESSDLSPRYVVDFLDAGISNFDMTRERSEFFNEFWDQNLKGNISNIFETDEYLCFNFAQGRTMKQVIYNKQKKNHKVLNLLKSKPFPVICVRGITNNSFFSVIDPFMLINMNKNNFYDKLISDFNMKSMQPGDNPIIISYNFKNI